MTESTQRGIIVPSPGQMVANGIALLALLRQLGLSVDAALGSLGAVANLSPEALAAIEAFDAGTDLADAVIDARTRTGNRPVGQGELVINVKDAPYGAKGDGLTDDTAAIQDALDAAGNIGNGATVLIPPGVYMINAVLNSGGALYPKSNTNIHLEGTLRCIPNDAGTSGNVYSVVYCKDVSNVSITGGGRIEGDRDDHDGTSGEFGHCLRINGCSDIKVDGITCVDAWGDGIVISGGAGATNPSSTRVYLSNITCDNNRRQGLSIISATEVVVSNCVFSNTNGTAPQAGVDIEPNPGETAADITLTGCQFIGNAGAGLLMYGNGATLTRINIVGGISRGNSGRGAFIQYADGVAVSGFIAEGNSGASGIEVTHSTDVSLSGCTARGTTGGRGFFLEGCSGVVLTGPKAYDNNSHGIWVYQNNTDIIVTGPHSKGNGSRGIFVSGTSGNITRNVRVLGGLATDNGLHGTSIGTFVQEIVFEGVQSIRNTQCGMLVEGGTNCRIHGYFADNNQGETASANTGSNIRVAGGTGLVIGDGTVCLPGDHALWNISLAVAVTIGAVVCPTAGSSGNITTTGSSVRLGHYDGSTVAYNVPVALNLPTTPGAAGTLWNDGGTVKVAT